MNIQHPQKKAVSRYKISGLLVLILIPGMMVWVMLSISDSSPAIPGKTLVNTDTAVDARRLVMELRALNKSPESLVQFVASEQELNSLITLASRAIPRVTGHASVSSWGLFGVGTIHIPENPFGSYVNFRVGVSPSEHGLYVNQVSLGKLHVSGDIAVAFARFGLNMLLNDRSGDRFLSAIKAVQINGDDLLVTFEPIPDIKYRLSRLGDIRDEMQLLGDLETIRRYYAQLCEIDGHHDHDTPISAMVYMVPVFELARRYSPDPQSAEDQNRAAMLALGVFLGSSNFASLVGDIGSATTTRCRHETPNIVFLKRRDLVQHFFISSTMEILANSQASFAVGEYKEFLDTTSGGFSVSDIAGNMAGIRFAQWILSPGPHALHAQTLVARATQESALFPDISGMPPKLPRQQFEATYGDLEDPRYQAMLADIERRLDRLPIYSSGK